MAASARRTLFRDVKTKINSVKLWQHVKFRNIEKSNESYEVVKRKMSIYLIADALTCEVEESNNRFFKDRTHCRNVSVEEPCISPRALLGYCLKWFLTQSAMKRNSLLHSNDYKLNKILLTGKFPGFVFNVNELPKDLPTNCFGTTVDSSYIVTLGARKK